MKATQEETKTEATEVTYLSSDSLMAHKRAEPLEETLPLPELGGSILVRGVGTYAERNRIYAEITALQEQAKAKRLMITSPATGEQYVPVGGDIAACWAAAAVAQPSLTSYQWLQFCGEGDTILARIFERVLVCSRMVEDKAKGIPDGEAAEEAELEENPT